jgi:S-DNA-T family DNA segregation ATPase FtsK/SpoIIIE
MTLHCTLVRGPSSGSPAPPLELTIEAPPGTLGDALQEALSAQFGTGPLTVNGVALPSVPLGVNPLTNGAVLVDGEVPLHTSHGDPGGSPLMLLVHSGPAAGMIVPLQRGTYRIGRSGTEIVIADPAMSREHARLEVSQTAVGLVDLGSVNGTLVDGRKIKHATVSTDSLISCGNSTLSLFFGPEPSASDRNLEAAGASVAEPLRIPRPPHTGGRTAVLLTAVLPLVIGVGLAVATGMWIFLGFTALSAVSTVIPAMAGRRQHRQLKSSISAAARTDEERRRRAAPSAAELVIGASASGPVPPRQPGAAQPLWLRLGLAVQPANIGMDPPDPEFKAPVPGPLPVTCGTDGATSIRGPRLEVMGLVRFVIMQLTGYPLAAGTPVLIHGAPENLPLAARFLDRVHLSSDEEACEAFLAAAPGPDCERGVLILIDASAPVNDPSALQATATSRGWQVIRCGDISMGASGTDICLGGPSARMSEGGRCTQFIPDFVPAQVFDRYCRQMASSADRRSRGSSGIPSTCSLPDLLPTSATETLLRWSGGNLRPGLPVPLGLTSTGPQLLDLEADGPHLLVAGTTGSGKSELLRTLITALALSYPPDRINFLFIDFKGGSGLGPLTGLPHCVGMLTDLSTHELERYLVSLRSEIRGREKKLAATRSPDLAAYRGTSAAKVTPLPQLILVIDEFRMLVEEAPEALTELMRIAAIGRSLGIHLIMATQRPQGALSADIRANVTTSIALRVQSEHESADIISSKAAAHIALTTPGRAYLARGTESASEFQTASVPGPGATACMLPITVRLAVDAVASPAGSSREQPAASTRGPGPGTIPIAESLVTLWSTAGGAPARRPVAGPLLSNLPFPGTRSVPDLGGDNPRVPDPVSGTPCAWSVNLGLTDEPEEQRVSPLIWLPSQHGHLALIGGTGGAHAAMGLAVQQLMEHDLESHLYVLDADGSFITACEEPRVGAVAGLHELRRGVRVLERVAHELSLRLSGAATKSRIPLVLVVSGWGSWISALRGGPLAWAEDLVQDIVRDGAKAGISVLISGDKELVTSRFFAAVQNRAYFPTGSTEESRLAWPRMPPTPPVQARSVVFGAIVASSPSVAQFYSAAADPPRAAKEPKKAQVAPFRIEPLPAKVSAAEVRLLLAGERIAAQAPERGEDIVEPWRGPGTRRIFVGIGGDELVPISLPLTAGSVLAVLGGPATGKSSLLAALPELNPSAGDWLGPAPGESAEDYWAEAVAEARTETGTSRNRRRTILLVDDADLLTPETGRHVLELHGMGSAVVLTAGFSPMLTQRVPLAAYARNHGNGILIAPRTIMDGDFFGLRFEVDAHPPVGRAVVISEGRAFPVQLAAGTKRPATALAGSPRRVRRNG